MLAADSVGTAAPRSTPLATDSSPRSTVPRGQSAAHSRSSRRSRPLDIEVRAGVHTGEVETSTTRCGGLAVAHRSASGGQGRRLGGPRLPNREGPRRRQRSRVRRRRRARAERRTRPLAPLPGGELGGGGEDQERTGRFGQRPRASPSHGLLGLRRFHNSLARRGTTGRVRFLFYLLGEFVGDSRTLCVRDARCGCGHRRGASLRGDLS